MFICRVSDKPDLSCLIKVLFSKSLILNSISIATTQQNDYKQVLFLEKDNSIYTLYLSKFNLE